MKILANDGMDAVGKEMLEKAGFTVVTEKVDQDLLGKEINEKSYVAITVRSATHVKRELIDACPGLKVIARGGVGMDNIDVAYAESKGIKVINTPAASSNSVAELVFAHAFSAVRFLYDSNRQMPTHGEKEFDALKKKYSKGMELRGKNFGIVGFGRIGQNVAKIALGLGMRVLAFDPFVKEAKIDIEIDGNQHPLTAHLKTRPLDEVLELSDIISFHVPGGNLIGEKEIKMMKRGVILINTSRGGVISEDALIEALDRGQVAHAGLDVYEDEPAPFEGILTHHKISMTPHIGAATSEAQERIGVELAEKLIAALGKRA